MTEIVSQAEWEAICDGCGLCCALLKKGAHVACPSLNVKTRRCMNYSTRHETEICVPMPQGKELEMHAHGMLPDSCAYVRRALKKPPLDIPEVALVPFALAPLKIRRKYKKARKRWLAKVAAL